MTPPSRMALVCTVALAAVLAATPSSGQTYTWSANGHTYQFVTADVDWNEANAAAAAAGGHLVTITSAAENQFLTSSFGSVIETTWTGGLQPAGSSEPDGGWTWVTGEPFSFVNWDGGEPNNNGGTENRIEWAVNLGANGYLWNDVPQDARRRGYLIEFEAAVPLAGWPGIGALVLLLGLAGAAALRSMRA